MADPENKAQPPGDLSHLLNLKVPCALQYDIPVVALLEPNGVNRVVEHYAEQFRSLITKLAIEAAACGGWETLLAKLKAPAPPPAPVVEQPAPAPPEQAKRAAGGRRRK